MKKLLMIYVWGALYNGLSVPYADAIIAFITIKNGLSLLTNDKHFKLIQVIDPRLKLL